MEKQNIWHRIYYKKKMSNFIILRPYQVYGPYQKYDRLIPMVIKSCLKNKKFPCTEGNQERDFLYVDDFTDLIIKILKKKILKIEFLMLDMANQ